MPERSGKPGDFWEREQVRPLGPAVSAPTHAAFPTAPAARTGPAPTGPPARVGGTVAALVVALLSLVPPLLGARLGVWFLLLGANVPGVALAVIALSKVPDASEVERYLRYTWACNLAYGMLCIPVVLIILLTLVVARALGL